MEYLGLLFLLNELGVTQASILDIILYTLYIIYLNNTSSTIAEKDVTLSLRVYGAIKLKNPSNNSIVRALRYLIMKQVSACFFLSCGCLRM